MRSRHENAGEHLSVGAELDAPSIIWLNDSFFAPDLMRLSRLLSRAVPKGLTITGLSPVVVADVAKQNEEGSAEIIREQLTALW